METRNYRVTIGEGPNPEEILWSTDHDDLEKVKADVRVEFSYPEDVPMKVERYVGEILPI